MIPVGNGTFSMVEENLVFVCFYVCFMWTNCLLYFGSVDWSLVWRRLTHRLSPQCLKGWCETLKQKFANVSNEASTNSFVWVGAYSFFKTQYICYPIHEPLLMRSLSSAWAVLLGDNVLSYCFTSKYIFKLLETRQPALYFLSIHWMNE